MSQRPPFRTCVALALLVCGACGRIDYEIGQRSADGGGIDGTAADAPGGAADGALQDGTGATDSGPTIDGSAPTVWENVRLTMTAARSSGPAIASAGTTYCVTWTEAVTPGFEAYARLYDEAFAPLSPATRISLPGTSAEVPIPVHNGSGWGAFWLEVGATSATVVGAELDASGAVITSPRALTGATSVGGNVAVTFGGGSYRIAWADSRWGGAEVVVAEVAIGLGSTTELRISNAPNISYFPAISWTGSSLGVAWADNRTGDYEIYFAPVGATGAGTEVRVTTSAGLSLLPALAFDGTAFGLAWNDAASGTDAVQFARVGGASGTVSGETTLSGPAGTLYPQIVYAGDRYVVVWGDDRDGPRRVYGRAVTASGTTSAVPIADPGAASGAPWIAWDGTRVVIVWEDARDGESEIYAARGLFR